MNLRKLYYEFDLFSPQECRDILLFNNDLEFTNYTIKLDNKFVENGSSMKSQNLVENKNTEWIFRKLTEKLNKKLTVKWINNPHGVFRYYEKGDYFLEHTDAVDKIDADPRYFTVTVQLSESNDYTGGEVIIDRQHTIGRKIGTAALWGADIIHEVKDILKGTRNALVFFVSSKHIKILNKPSI